VNRVQNVKLILWLITGIAAAVGLARFVFGLGATTNLSDATPWGLWIGFDVMAGVALAGGGFVLTAIFYVFKRDEFRSLVRPAVLTAFLGYLAVIFGLLFDLGLPWNIWHMMIYWNPHSPLFEVGWCVMLYTTVLLLEFSPVPMEETSRYAKIRNFLMKFRFPLVLLGIMLSTLHQSSLGSLFLIMPFKLHPLWYSNILPVQFFISAVALGLMMVSLESLVSHWLYGRASRHDLIARLAKGARWVLLAYLLVKVVDLAASGKLGLVFSGTWESILYILEMSISTILPLIIFSIPRLRNNPAGQWAGSLMVVLGMVMNRIDVGGLAMVHATGSAYSPSWMEISLSLGVVSGAILVFLFAIEKFHIWEDRPRHPEADRYAPAKFDRASEVWLGAPRVASRTKYSLAFVLSFAVTFAVLPFKKIESKGVEEITVQKPRGGEVLFIDGNRDQYGVLFNHTRHAADTGTAIACAQCHHMDMPQDKQSECWECHRGMYTPTDVFGHDWHASAKGAAVPCDMCHQVGPARKAATAKQCADCHLDLVPVGAVIVVNQYQAPSYTDAMHDLCVPCHKQKSIELADKPNLGKCSCCHQNTPPIFMRPEIEAKLQGPRFNRVVIPTDTTQPQEMERHTDG
jgi:Ni/Fe-hydrogenase subunit HybB-like protein